MSEAELIFTALAELSTRQIAKTEEAKGLQKNVQAGKKGGSVAKKCAERIGKQNRKKYGNRRKLFTKKTGR